MRQLFNWWLSTLLITFSTLFAASEYPIGMNTNYFDYWSGQIAFVDAIKQSSKWIAHTQGTDEWSSGVDVPMDSNDYPLKIPYTPPGGQPQVVKTVMFLGIDSHYPAGTYTLIYEGTGIINIKSIYLNSTFYEAGTYQVEITPFYWGITLEISESLESDPVRNIRFILPGYADVYQTQPFYPPFIERLQGFLCLRASHPVNFGTWPCDNGVDVTDATCEMQWATRPTPEVRTQVGPRGLAVEYHIGMANAAGCDLWACVVHAANDDFVRQYARFIRDSLNPEHKVYLELSNETWNSADGFPQTVYFKNLGIAQGLDDPYDEWKGSHLAFARRSAQIYTIFEEEFALQPTRLVKIMPSHLSRTSISQTRLEALEDENINLTGSQADVLAIGAYFGSHIADEIVSRGEVSTITTTEILDSLESSIFNDQPNTIYPQWGPCVSFKKTLLENMAVADSFGVQLISYEGGPYLVATGDNIYNDTLTEKLITANQDSRIYHIYSKMLYLWFEENPNLFMAFTYVGEFSKYGCAGALEWMDQPICEAHKYRALINLLNSGCITSK